MKTLVPSFVRQAHPPLLRPGVGFRLVHVAAALLLLAGPGRAQDLVWKSFDTDTGGFGCGDWGATHLAEWDGTRDAANNPVSGSLRVTGEFAAGSTGLTLQNCGSIADLSIYRAFALDVYVDPAATPDANGNYGTLTVRLRPGWAWPGDVMSFGAITATGWTHLERPLPVTATGFSGLNIHWDTAYTSAAQLTLDNLTFIAKDVVTVWKGFDTDNGGFGCGDWGVAHTATFDPAVDVLGNPASGSLAVEAQFTAGGEVTVQVCSGMGSLGTNDKLAMDVYVDPGASPDPNGNFGTFAIRLRPGWAWPGYLVEFGPVTATGWTHLQKELPPTAAGFSGLDVHWKTAYTATAKVWIDNIAFVSSAAPPPPPSLVVDQALPGLEVATSGSGDYSRKNIATVAAYASRLPWVNAGGPVTYAMTINETVAPTAAGFAANIMLIGTEAGSINPSPDWNEPNGVFLEAGLNAAGRVDVSVRYKTNAPGTHGIRFQAEGLLVNMNSTLTSLVGTWALTLDGANVTLTGPGDVTGTGILTDDALPLFGVNLYALFGAQPYTNKDRRISLSRVRVAGPAGWSGNLEQEFTTATAINAEILETKEEDPGVVRLKPTTTVFRIAWQLPDTGFELWSSPSLKPVAWSALGLTPVPQGLYKTVYVPAEKATTPEQYFRLRKP